MLLSLLFLKSILVYLIYFSFLLLNSIELSGYSYGLGSFILFLFPSASFGFIILGRYLEWIGPSLVCICIPLSLFGSFSAFSPVLPAIIQLFSPIDFCHNDLILLLPLSLRLLSVLRFWQLAPCIASSCFSVSSPSTDLCHYILPFTLLLPFALLFPPWMLSVLQLWKPFSLLFSALTLPLSFSLKKGSL